MIDTINGSVVFDPEKDGANQIKLKLYEFEQLMSMLIRFDLF